MKIRIELDVEKKIMNIGNWCCTCEKEIEDQEEYYEPTSQNKINLLTLDGREVDCICKECASQSD